MSDTTRSEGSTGSCPADSTLSLLTLESAPGCRCPTGSAPPGILCVRFGSAQLDGSSPAFAITYKANTEGNEPLSRTEELMCYV